MSDAAIVALAIIVAVSVVVIIVRPRQVQRQHMTKDRHGAIPVLRQPLSPREREVASLAARGLTNKEIGARLHLSAATVRNHMTSAYGKLGVTRRDDLASIPYLASDSQQTPDKAG